MLTTGPLKGLVIRTAAVRDANIGYIYAEDPALTDDESPHAITVKYANGSFKLGKANFDAHSTTLICDPEDGLVTVSEAGYYSATLRSGKSAGDLFEDSAPPPRVPRITGIRSVATAAGKAYAIGLRGFVYRFDGPKRWARIDDGLPETFNGQAIHGFALNELYAVGRGGQLWQFDGRTWVARDLPTSVTLTCVGCAADGQVYVGGHEGVLLRGRHDRWEVVDHAATGDDIWSVGDFLDAVYFSTMKGVFRLDGDAGEAVRFGADVPGSCYQLSVGDGVMWSVGEFDIMAFDGRSWRRIV